ncbi:9175_t:CDS:2, partial [Entrophospora sp. SA101]
NDRFFWISCDDMNISELKNLEMVETLFGRRLLYEALKYHLKGIKNFEEFCEIIGKDLISLHEVLKTILIYKPRTHASFLFNSIASSDACIQEISLPLLISEHAQEVFLDLANWTYKTKYFITKSRKIKEISPNLKHIINLLGVVGCYLEIMIFEMAIIGFKVTQTTTLGKRKIEDLEMDELIFLNKKASTSISHFTAMTESQRGKCRLSELVPLEGQSDKYIEFGPKFVVHSTPYRVDKDHWNQFFNDYSKEFKESNQDNSKTENDEV